MNKVSDSKVSENIKNPELIFQSYRWQNDPVFQNLGSEAENVPQHIKDRLEAMKLKYQKLEVKTFKNSKTS